MPSEEDIPTGERAIALDGTVYTFFLKGLVYVYWLVTRRSKLAKPKLDFKQPYYMLQPPPSL